MKAATFLSWAVSCSQGRVVICLSLEHKGPDASTCPQVVIFSSAPGGQLFSQEPGQALSVVSETKALTYTLLARLVTSYLKLKFSNSRVSYQKELPADTVLLSPAKVIVNDILKVTGPI